MPGGIPLESLAGIAWNPWPESNGITGRDHVESVAGIVWNLHKEPETTNSLKLVRTERRKRLFEHVPISADFYLVVRDGLFSEDELEEMKGLLAKFKKSKNKS